MAFDFEHEDKSVEALLNKTPYHALKEEFKKLGIEDVWKGGRKKTDMIEDAVEKLAKIKQEIEVNRSTEEEAIEKLPELEAAEQEVIDAEIVEAELKEEIRVEEEVSELELLHTVDGKLNVESIKASILKSEKGVRQNTFSGMKVRRKIHLDRLDALNILLEKAIK
tara:strand:+ start:274 stop:771 length:498 start_codon:yes stop_codon:yes gene_type:complete